MIDIFGSFFKSQESEGQMLMLTDEDVVEVTELLDEVVEKAKDTLEAIQTLNALVQCIKARNNV